MANGDWAQFLNRNLPSFRAVDVSAGSSDRPTTQVTLGFPLRYREFRAVDIEPTSKVRGPFVRRDGNTASVTEIPRSTPPIGRVENSDSNWDEVGKLVEVHSLGVNGMSLKAPIVVTVSDLDKDGVYVAGDEFSTAYGTGDTSASAVENYIQMLRFHVEDLVKDQEVLGEHFQDELRRVGEYVDWDKV